MITHFKIKVLYAVCFLVVSAVAVKILCQHASECVRVLGADEVCLSLLIACCVLVQVCLSFFYINQLVRFSVGIEGLQFLLPVKIFLPSQCSPGLAQQEWESANSFTAHLPALVQYISAALCLKEHY